jgi:hypothetical protein
MFNEFFDNVIKSVIKDKLEMFGNRYLPHRKYFSSNFFFIPVRNGR